MSYLQVCGRRSPLCAKSLFHACLFAKGNSKTSKLIFTLFLSGEAEILGGQFDYISVTPPYEAVNFPELMEQLSTSPLVKEDTCIVSNTYTFHDDEHLHINKS